MIALRAQDRVDIGWLARLLARLRGLVWRREVEVADLTPMQRLMWLSLTRVK